MFDIYYTKIHIFSSSFKVNLVQIPFFIEQETLKYGFVEIIEHKSPRNVFRNGVRSIGTIQHNL